MILGESNKAMISDNNDINTFEANLRKENAARLFINFHQAAEAFFKYEEMELYDTGLSPIRLAVLASLRAHRDIMTPSLMARLTFRDKNSITTIIKHLEEEQFIEIKKNEKDNRSYYISITEKGTQAIIKAIPTIKEIYNNIMSSIPDSSYEVLEKSFKTIQQNACQGLANKDI
jgi:DNA-binding MarR family transcriptional regulator